MDRVRKFSLEVMNLHKSQFGTNFNDNKNELDKISIIRSKGLKNEIAGFITKFIKREKHKQQEKEEREKQFNQQVVNTQTEQISEPINMTNADPLEVTTKPTKIQDDDYKKFDS